MGRTFPTRVAPNRCLCRPHSQGRKACRSTGSAGHKNPLSHQPQDRQGARPYRPGNAVGHRRRGDSMKRREFLAGLGGAVVWPLVARAQQLPMPVIGWLNGVPGTMERYLPRFNQGLAETGYIVGRNVTIESREGGLDHLPALAADLVRRKVTVIAAVGVRSAQAAKAATQTIPVVFAMVGDPVEVGVVASLNRPSGNLTGVTGVGSELAGKRLELLHKLVPAADTIAYLRRISDLGGFERANLQTAA